MTSDADTAGLPAQIRQMSFRYGISEARIMEMLKAAPETEGGVDTGDKRSEKQLSHLSRSLDIGGTEAWVHRVENAHGPEALFDQEFRFLAVSRAGRTIVSLEGECLELPRSAFVGARYANVLPSAVSFLGDGKPGFEGLRDLGFFKGKILGLQVELEMNFGFHFIDCVMEIWAVWTLDRGILAHSALHRTNKANPTIKPPGVDVRSVRFL